MPEFHLGLEIKISTYFRQLKKLTEHVVLEWSVMEYTVEDRLCS